MATMYRTGELPLAESASKAGYPLPGTPEVLYNVNWFIV